ncbi:MAG: FG-GAP-like repeat-containing protein [Planctomycetota bacterium]
MHRHSGNQPPLTVEALEPRLLFSGVEPQFDGPSDTDVQFTWVVAVADFNNDGFDDTTNGINVRLSDGKGGVAEERRTPVMSGAAYPTTFIYDVIAEDFNRDGNMDLAVKLSSMQSEPLILLGDGTGDFDIQEQDQRGRALFVNEMLTGDFDGDGDVDILYSYQYGFSKLALRNNIGGGQFEERAVDIDTNDQNLFSGHMAADDLNGDGKDDLIFGSRAEGIGIYLSEGDGVFRSPKDTLYAEDAVQIAIGDFNNDGRTDLLTIASAINKSKAETFEIDVYLGRGNGVFKSPVTSKFGIDDNLYKTGSNWVRTQASAGVDLNSDGYDDIALFLDDTLYVLTSNQNGKLSEASRQHTKVYRIFQVSHGDLDGDGDQDLAVGGSHKNKGSVAATFLNQTVPAPSAPVVGFTGLKTKASESGKKAKFKATRDGDTTEELRVKLKIGGKAKYGRDYELKLSSAGSMDGKHLVFHAGSSVVKVKLIPIDDKKREKPESIEIKIKPGPGFVLPANLGRIFSVFDGMLIDDD